MYETLSLAGIESAATQTGVFHFNYFLELRLASPHFKDGQPAQTFDVMVMRNLEDGIFSFAIDEFPVMDEDAIEEHWIEKVERHRKEREAAFAELEREALEEAEEDEQAAAETVARAEGAAGGADGADATEPKDEL